MAMQQLTVFHGWEGKGEREREQKWKAIKKKEKGIKSKKVHELQIEIKSGESQEQLEEGGEATATSTHL